MGYNTITKESTMIVIVAEANLGGHRFKAGREVDTVVTRLLTTQKKGCAPTT
jgi:hypothetical protein